MTESDRTKITLMWESRLTIEQIVSLLPHPRRIAEKMIKQMQADGSLEKRSRREMITQKICQDYANGNTNVYELAAKYDLKVNTINLYLRASGLKSGRPAHNYRKKELNGKAQQIVADILADELTSAEIARKHNVTRQYVYQLKKKTESDK